MRRQDNATHSNRLRLPECRHAYQLCHAVLFSDKNSMTQKFVRSAKIENKGPKLIMQLKQAHTYARRARKIT